MSVPAATAAEPSFEIGRKSFKMRLAEPSAVPDDLLDPPSSLRGAAAAPERAALPRPMSPANDQTGAPAAFLAEELLPLRATTPPREAPLRQRDDDQVPVVKMATSTLIGLLLIAFTCGILATIAVDRALPADDAAIASSR